MDLISAIQINQYYFPLIIQGLALYLLLVWLGVVAWVWRDISTRSRNFLTILSSVLGVLLGNIPGLLVYLLVRPQVTIEEKESNLLLHASIIDKDITTCPECSILVRKDFNFCPNCQSDLILKCEECSHRVNPEWNYCVNCQHRLVELTFSEKLTNTIKNRISEFRKSKVSKDVQSEVIKVEVGTEAKKKDQTRDIILKFRNLSNKAIKSIWTVILNTLKFVFNIPQNTFKLIGKAWNNYLKLVERAIVRPIEAVFSRDKKTA